MATVCADINKIDGRKRNPGNAANLTNAGKGRPKGTPNKATVELKALAREYTQEAVAKLVEILRTSDNPTAIISAANSLLDRGYGKPSTVLSGDEEGGPVRYESVGWHVRDTQH